MATTVPIREGYDTWVSSAAPTSKHPIDNRLRLQGTSAYAYVYFPLGPELRNVTILSATLYLYGRGTGWGSQTVTVNAITQAWDAGTLTWNNKPTVGTTAATLTQGNPTDLTEWAVDVTALVAEFASGSRWRGMRVAIGDTVERRFNSLNAVGPKPRLVVTWTEAPAAPVDQSPAGGRAVSVSRPTLTWSNENSPEGTSLTAFEVQIDPAANGTTPAFASGTVTSDLAEYDLSQTSYAGLAEGATTQWRVRVRNDAGLWSAWSDWATFTRTAKGSVTITTPSSGQRVIRRNLVANPSFEVDTTLWTAVRCTLTRDTAWSAAGAASARATVTDATATPYVFAQDAAATALDPVATNDYLSARVKVKAIRAGRVRLTVEQASSTGANLGLAVNGDSGYIELAAGEERVIELRNAQATAATVASVQSVLYLHASGATTPAPLGDHCYVDAMLVENHGQTAAEAPTVTYFDGDTADVAPYDYAWTGTAHASASEFRAPASTVAEHTPPVAWTTTFTQKAWRVRVLDPADPTRVLHDTGRRAGTTQDYTIPARDPATDRRILVDDRSYQLTVWAWDDVDREATPGDPRFASATVVFHYVDDPTPNQVTALVATQVTDTPYVDLTWQRTTTPDSWTIIHNGKTVETGIPGAELLVSGTSYKYRYKDARPGAHDFKVKPTVNGLTAGSPTASVTIEATGLWVMGPDDIDVLVGVLGDDFGSFAMPDRATTFELPQGLHPVRITQGVSGLRGDVRGALSLDGGRTADEWADRLLKLKKRYDEGVTLYFGDVVIRARIFDIVVEPSRDGDTRLVSFGFYQTGTPDWLD
jgi:hypothetical protein